jgi:hypothetical protein
MAENECPQSVHEAVNRLIGMMDAKEIDDAYATDKSSFTLTMQECPDFSKLGMNCTVWVYYYIY